MRTWIRTHWKGWTALALYICAATLFMHFMLKAGTHDEPKTGGMPPTTTTTAPLPITVNVPPATIVPGPGTETKEIIQQPTVKIIREESSTPTTSTTRPPTTTTSSSTTSTTRFGCVRAVPQTC